MIYAFEDCLLDDDRHELRLAGQVVAVEPKVFQVLLYLLEHRDRVVTKDDLFAHCWPGTFVSEAALTRCLAKVRQAVQAGHTGAPVIKTIHRQGYRFVAVVSTAEHQTPSEQAAVLLPQTARETTLPAASPAAPIELAPLARPADASSPSTVMRRPSAAERRQVTILCCTLADAARLARQLDPDDLHGLVQDLHTLGTEVVQRWGGHLAQYHQDGLLAYFGYPQAQEHDAERAVRAALGIVEELTALNARLALNAEGRIVVQIGMHTGSVVIGELGSVALGTTPDVAAGLAALAVPETVVISAATARLVEGYFVWEALGEHQLPGATSSMEVYRVLHESGVQTRFEVMATRGLTPLVGREPEVGLLLERWALAREGLGQVVLLSGEAGIGKSRLVRVLTERVMEEGAPRVTFRCSPYHTHSALYPVLEHLQQLLHFHREDRPQARLDKLEQGIGVAGLPHAEVVPLFAALLSVPLLERYAPMRLSPEQQKRQTLETLVRWLLLQAERQPMLTVWEDLHWADPSTLELLSLILDQTPTARLLHLLTYRPEFQPPWSSRAHLTSLTLTRLSRPRCTPWSNGSPGAKRCPLRWCRW
jgi:class 3 adenylate cyclase